MTPKRLLVAALLRVVDGASWVTVQAFDAANRLSDGELRPPVPAPKVDWFDRLGLERMPSCMPAWVIRVPRPWAARDRKSEVARVVVRRRVIAGHAITAKGSRGGRPS